MARAVFRCPDLTPAVSLIRKYLGTREGQNPSHACLKQP